MEDKATKTKEKSTIVKFEVHSLKDADRALQLLGRCEADRGKLTARLTRRMIDAEKEIKPDLEAVQSEMQELIEALQKFSEEKKDQLFAKKRSIELRFGTIGFQKSTQLVCKPGVDWKKVLDVAKKYYPKYTAEKWEIVKAALKKASEEEMDTLGVQIEEKDTFYAAGKDKERYEVS